MSGPVQRPVVCACGKTFRPQQFGQRRCHDCIAAFVFADEVLPPGQIIYWTAPRGVCARASCRKPFEYYPNQRYCCPECRFKAIDERAAARELAQQAAVRTRGARRSRGHG